MTCFHPLKAFQIGKTESGKKKLVVCSYNIDYIIYDSSDESVSRCVGSADLERKKLSSQKFVDHNIHVISDFIEVPCGQCLGCRLKYAKEWSLRCMLEASQYTNNYFVTLTYDNEHVPHSVYLNPDTGVFTDTLTLNDRDLTLFFKRLRSKLNYNDIESFRYYACGEYGDRTFRPHFHFIGFNLRLNDLVEIPNSSNEYGNRYYASQTLNKCWGKGNVIVGNCTVESCQYVARYVVKKQKGQNAHVYSDVNIMPPFIRMSRRPGIASNVIDSKIDEFWHDKKIILTTATGGYTFGIPRYIQCKFEQAFPFEYDKYKADLKEIAENLKEVKMQNVELSYLEQLQIEEDNLKSKYFNKNIRKV